MTVGYYNPQVKQVVSGAASRANVKRGDRIISVNGIGLSGKSTEDALSVLKEAGEHVTLILSRKIGRRVSKTTPMTSTLHSRKGSAGPSRSESRRISPQLRRRRGSCSSEDGSVEGSSPPPSRKHRRRESVSAQGEVLTFRDKKSTLPRRFKGVKSDMHLVELHKGSTGLGMQLLGGADSSTPIAVKTVLRGGPAFKSGKIKEGDEILEVNAQSFENFNHQEALQFMKDLPQGKVKIILRDHKAMNQS